MQTDPIPVPLHGRDGTIKAFAVVDQADGDRVGQWPWWIRNGAGYVGGMVEGQVVLLHHFIYGEVPGGLVLDHINRCRLDNRRANLRVVTNAQNAQNQGSRGGSSSFRGVTWDKSRGKWMATGMLDGKRRTLGRFDSEDEAGRVAAEWRAAYMPFSAEAAA